MNYLYKGSLVKIVNDLGSIAIIQLPDQSKTSVGKQELTPAGKNAVLDASTVVNAADDNQLSILQAELYDNGSEELVSNLVSSATRFVDESELTEENTEAEVVAEDSGDENSDEDNENEDNNEKININELEYDELIELRGIGKVSARKILENKPSGGYVNEDQLTGLNADLYRIDWGVVLSQIYFG